MAYLLLLTNLGGYYMNDLNSVLLEGRLTADPELSYTSKGTAICKFSIAVNRKYKTDTSTQDEVSFVNIETWNKTAEACSSHLAKGRGVRVVGRIKQERWKQENRNRSRIIIIGEHIEFLPGKTPS